MRVRLSASSSSDIEQQPEPQRDEPVFLDRDLPEDERAAKGRRRAEVDRLGAEQSQQQLLDDDRAADGDEDLFEMPAIDRRDQQPLIDIAERAPQTTAAAASAATNDRKVDPERAMRRELIDDGRREGADGDEGAVAEIEHVHHARRRASAPRP